MSKPEDKLKEMKDKLKGLQKEKPEEKKGPSTEELIDTLQHLQAEFENYRKHVEKEKARTKEYAHRDLITKLLPILDSFELAVKSDKDPERFRKGVEMIYAQFVSILKSEGLKPIEAAGMRFDPHLHEVLLKQESDKPEDTVLEELQKGYQLKDWVIRHSKVKISKPKEDKKSESPNTPPPTKS